MHKGPALRIPPLMHDSFVDLIAYRGEPWEIEGQTALVGQTQRPIQRHPALDFRIHKVLLPPADLPYTVVGSHPIVGHPI